MTMHLVGPWLTTTGKPRGKKKYRTASQAATDRANRAAWQAMLDKYKVPAADRRQPMTTVKLPTDPGPYRRDTGPRVPSVDTGQGQAVVPEPKRYTGEQCIGIGQLHKSNGVPIFRKQDAEDIAKMRR